MLLLSDVKDFEKAAKGLSGMVMYVMLPAAEPAIIKRQTKIDMTCPFFMFLNFLPIIITPE